MKQITYKTYNKNTTTTSKLEVYAWPLTSSFPTKDYFYDGEGNLMKEEYEK